MSIHVEFIELFFHLFRHVAWSSVKNQGGVSYLVAEKMWTKARVYEIGFDQLRVECSTAFIDKHCVARWSEIWQNGRTWDKNDGR